MLRKLARSVAHYRMRIEGIQKPNKRHMAINPRSGMLERMPSYFSEHWREYAGYRSSRKAA